MIVSQQLELRASERMTDADDGGGEMAAVINSNDINTIFDPISESDRTTGRTSLRQLYVHVNSEDDEKLLGANVIISKPPTDPAVNIAIFSSGSVGEERTSARTTIENFLAPGGRSHWHPMGSLQAGQLQILVYQKKRTTTGWKPNIPQVGDVLILSIETGEFAGTNQAICIQSLYYYTDTLTYSLSNSLSEMEAIVFVLTLKQPLAFDFPGADPSPLYPGDTWLRTTVPTASARFHGICQLSADAALNATQINVKDLYQPIIATSILESNVNDANLALQSDAVTPYSSYQEVTIARRSTMWTTILNPLPLTGSVRVGFRAGGKWYVLADIAGVLQGPYISDGSGTVNYTTGAVSLQTGATPDIDSYIIWQWNSVVQESNQAIPLKELYGYTIYSTQNVISIAIENKIATVTVPNARLYKVHQIIRITGDSEGMLNGDWKITNIISDTKFEFYCNINIEGAVGAVIVTRNMTINIINADPPTITIESGTYIEFAKQECFSKYEIVPGTVKLKYNENYFLVDRFGDGKIYLAQSDGTSLGIVGAIYYPEKIVTLCDFLVMVNPLVIQGGQLRTAATIANNCTATLATKQTTQQLTFDKTVHSLAITYTTNAVAKTITTQDWNAYTDTEIADIALTTNGNTHTVVTEWKKWPDIGTNIVTVIAEATPIAPTTFTTVIPITDYNLAITYTNESGTRTETIENVSISENVNITAAMNWFTYTDINSISCTYSGGNAHFTINWNVPPNNGSTVNINLSLIKAYATCVLNNVKPESQFFLTIQYTYQSNNIEEIILIQDYYPNGPIVNSGASLPIEEIIINNRTSLEITFTIIFEAGSEEFLGNTINFITSYPTNLIKTYQYSFSTPQESENWVLFDLYPTNDELYYYKKIATDVPSRYETGLISSSVGMNNEVISYLDNINLVIDVKINGGVTTIFVHTLQIYNLMTSCYIKIYDTSGTLLNSSDFITGYSGDLFHIEKTATIASFIADDATYTQSGVGESSTNTLAVPSSITIDLTPDKPIIPASLRFTWDNKTYGDPNTDNKIYAINLAGNATDQVGTINYTTNKITITDASIYTNANPTVTACRTENSEAISSSSTITSYVGRVADVIVPNTFAMKVNNITATTEYTLTANANGNLTDANGNWGKVIHDMGIVQITTPNSIAINPATIKASYTAQHTIPLSVTELGLDPVRLPTNGKVAMLNIGDRAVVHQTFKYELPATPQANSTVTLPYDNLARVAIVDSQGRCLPDTVLTYGDYVTYTDQPGYLWWEVNADGKVWVPSATDLVAGRIQFAATLNLTDYIAPFTILCVKEDVAMVTDTDISGMVQLNSGLTHAYTIAKTAATDGAYVSSQLWLGDLWARYENLFTLEAWTGQWSNTDSDNPISAAYDDLNYPIQITNNGVVEERWRVTMISVNNPNTSNEVAKFEVVGERIGTIGYGITSANFAVNNPATGVPYFTIYANGWKTGWAVGNTVRFNTVFKNNFWAAKCVTSSITESNYDDFKITVRGDTSIV